MFRSLFDKFTIKKSSIKKCSFCGCSENDSNPLIAGDGAYICSNCVLSAYNILFEDQESEEIYTNELGEIDFLDAIRK